MPFSFLLDLNVTVSFNVMIILYYTSVKMSREKSRKYGR